MTRRIRHDVCPRRAYARTVEDRRANEIAQHAVNRRPVPVFAADAGKNKFGWAWQARTTVGAFAAGCHTVPDTIEALKVRTNMFGPGFFVVEIPDHNHGSTTRDIIAVVRAAQKLIDEADKLGWTTHATDPLGWKASISKPEHHAELIANMPDTWLRVLASSYRGGTVEKIRQYVTRAVEQQARGKDPSYGWSLHNTLDAVGIMTYTIGATNMAGTWL